MDPADTEIVYKAVQRANALIHTGTAREQALILALSQRYTAEALKDRKPLDEAYIVCFFSVVTFAYQLVGSYICAMTTREAIVVQGDHLIRDKGYNAFSFYDISRSLKIKNSSIHYHFATKADLGVEVVNRHIVLVEQLIKSVEARAPEVKLRAFLSIYDYSQQEERVCLVGSLATDWKTVEPKMKKELTRLADTILAWITQILSEGKRQGVFSFEESARTKALMLVTNMLGALQVSRITGAKDFFAIRDGVIKQLKGK
ncbi:MAG: TetR/AcrR family transcriptional regulator [Flammeovirgaceae bacterium]